jgi:hypothetical protein
MSHQPRNALALAPQPVIRSPANADVRSTQPGHMEHR